MWGRRRKHPPKDHFVFGTIQEEDRVIRINPVLDQAFVPLWFLKYVLYHEMLHSVVPDKNCCEWTTMFTPKNSTGVNANFTVLSRTSVGRRNLARFLATSNRVA